MKSSKKNNFRHPYVSEFVNFYTTCSPYQKNNNCENFS